MTEDKNYMPPVQEEEELEIDWMGYARKLWDARKLLLKVAGIAVIVGIVIALTTPKQYTVNVTLAPEQGNSRRNSSLSSIASMMGLNMGMATESDAIGVLLYPDVVKSTPFIIDLLDTPVQTLDEEKPDTTLVEYLKTNKSTLLGTVMSLPGRAIGAVISLFKEAEEETVEKPIDPFHLTKAEAMSVRSLRSKIMANVDKKTGVTSISVTMQDPLVAAIVTDTLLSKLKDHIISYRISKAEEDCKYYEKLYEESQANYHSAQKIYADFLDKNKSLILKSVQIEGERLQNEVNLAYSIYNQMAGQLQMGRAKIQEAKPMFAVVEPATVPLHPSGTSRKIILIGIVFLAVAGAGAWVLFGQDFWNNMKESLKKKDEK